MCDRNAQNLPRRGLQTEKAIAFRLQASAAKVLRVRSHMAKAAISPTNALWDDSKPKIAWCSLPWKPQWFGARHRRNSNRERNVMA